MNYQKPLISINEIKLDGTNKNHKGCFLFKGKWFRNQNDFDTLS
jgi:hypothetical protein